jgi:hypothetical protein
MFQPMCNGDETIKIMEAIAEHDFGSIWLIGMPCTTDETFTSCARPESRKKTLQGILERSPHETGN